MPIEQHRDRVLQGRTVHEAAIMRYKCSLSHFAVVEKR